MSFASLLNTSATIKRNANTGADSWGGRTSAFATVGTYNARIDRQFVRENVAGQADTISNYILFLEPAADVQRQDQAVIGSDTYRVIHVNNAGGGLNHHYECDVVLEES